MATKRTPINRGQRRRVTPEVLAAFRAGDHEALAVALRLKPWEINPLDIADDEPCPYQHSIGATSWEQALELRRELKAETQ